VSAMKMDEGKGGEEVARVVVVDGVTRFTLHLVGATVPPAQSVGACRQDTGTNGLGFPPCWLRHVAVSTCPAALFLHVALVWVAFEVLPCVQQYPRCTPVVFGAVGGRAVGVVVVVDGA
jgi:hypothetical protein